MIGPRFVIATDNSAILEGGSEPSFTTTVTKLDCSSHPKPLAKRGLETDTRKAGIFFDIL